MPINNTPHSPQQLKKLRDKVFKIFSELTPEESDTLLVELFLAALVCHYSDPDDAMEAFFEEIKSNLPEEIARYKMISSMKSNVLRN